MPASEPITAVANALTQVGITLQPFIEESFAQKYEREHTARIAEWLSLINQPLDGDVANHINTFVSGLLASAGAPAGGMGTCISVPVDSLTSLIAECSESIKKDQMLAKMQFRQR